VTMWWAQRSTGKYASSPICRSGTDSPQVAVPRFRDASPASARQTVPPSPSRPSHRPLECSTRRTLERRPLCADRPPAIPSPDGEVRSARFADSLHHRVGASPPGFGVLSNLARSSSAQVRMELRSHWPSLEIGVNELEIMTRWHEEVEATMARAPEAGCPYWWIDPYAHDSWGICAQESTELALEADRRYTFHDFKGECDFQDDRNFMNWCARWEKGQKENVNTTNSIMRTSPRPSPRLSPRLSPRTSPRASPRACPSPGRVLGKGSPAPVRATKAFPQQMAKQLVRQYHSTR